MNAMKTNKKWRQLSSSFCVKFTRGQLGFAVDIALDVALDVVLGKVLTWAVDGFKAKQEWSILVTI